MEVCKIKIAKEVLQQLVDLGCLETHNFKVLSVDEEGFDYENNEAWKLAKLASDKAFKELKKIEFNIRNK